MAYWHLLDPGQVLSWLDITADAGLTPGEVEIRRDQYGPNEIQEQCRRGVLRMFLDQFADFMIVVLIAAGVVAGVVGEPQDSIAIVVIVVLNAVIGFVQEYRAERAVAALKQLAAPSARVRRDGAITTVAAKELVPGDVVLLEAGNIVPADLRLIEAAQLKAEEAALTGESQAVETHTREKRDEAICLLKPT